MSTEFFSLCPYFGNFGNHICELKKKPIYLYPGENTYANGMSKQIPLERALLMHRWCTTHDGMGLAVENNHIIPREKSR